MTPPVNPASHSPPRTFAGRWLRRLRWCLPVVFILAIAAYCSREYWANQLHDTFRAYYLGRVQMAAYEHGLELQTVDELEILALGGEFTPGEPDTFPADFGNVAAGTLNRRTLKGADAEAVARIWRVLPTRPLNPWAWCHHPYYALRFRSHGRLVLETSVCWSCGTYSLPVRGLGTTHYGFDSRSAKAQELLSVLTQYAPHPESRPQ